MNKGQIERAERLALNNLDRWNDVTGVVGLDTGHYYELQDVIRDSVHIGVQMALYGNVKSDEEGNVDTTPRSSTRPTMMPFGEAPIGARFRYPGSDKVWVKLNSYPEGLHHSGRGLICEWIGYDKGFQQFCAFCDEDSEITFATEVELVD
jgi:hypothetical protein